MFLFLVFFSWLAKILHALSRLIGAGSGTSISGYLVERYAKHVLSLLSSSYEHVIYVSGTNGKTTTTTALYKILTNSGLSVCSNIGGANIFRGIAGAILRNLDWKGKPRSRILLMEVEEATLPHLMRYIPATEVILLNIFRDQLDVYGELDTTVRYFSSALSYSPHARVWINGDDTLLMGSVALFAGERVIFGVSHPAYAQYERSSSSQSKATPDIIIDYINERLCMHSSDNTLSFEIHKPALESYNVANIAVASLVSHTLGVPLPDVQKGVDSLTTLFGRGEQFLLGSTTLTLFLIKNPAGAESVLAELTKQKMPFQLVFAINDAIADGADVSWLWDVPLETLLPSLGVSSYQVLGSRRLDILLRLSHALNSSDELGSLVPPLSFEHFIDGVIADKKSTPVIIVATYTAMRQIRAAIGKHIPLADMATV